MSIAGAVLRWAHWVVDVIRHWRWQHTAAALILAALTTFYRGSPLHPHIHGPVLSSWAYNVLQFGLPMVFAVGMADRAIDAGARRVVAYASAVILVIHAGVKLIGPLAAWVLPALGAWSWTENLPMALSLALPLSLGVAAYAQWHAEQQSMRRLQQRSMERLAGQQKLQAAQLLALQARVEPQLLFDTLQGVAGRIPDAPAAAAELLAELIALLRVLLPTVGGAGGSTVEREGAVAQAWSRVVAHAAGGAPGLELRIADEAAQAALAPMLLLPLLRALPQPATGPWRLQASLEAGRLRVAITRPDLTCVEVATALTPTALGALRARLSAVHGDQTRIHVHAAGPAGVTIELPLHHA